MVREAIKLIELHGRIKAFVETYSLQIGPVIEHIDRPRGGYLSALATSIDAALNPFRKHIVEVEQRYLANPDQSLGFILSEVRRFETFFYFIIHFMDDAKDFHGCAILKLLHKHTLHADSRVMEAIKTIRKGVYGVFLRQLSQWLIYGHLVDQYEEFFIVHSEVTRKQPQNISGTMPLSGFLTTTTTNANISEANANADLWQYHIAYDMLPANFSPAWAEKVLFIGQTVRMVKQDARKIGTKKMSIWDDDDDDDDYVIDIGSLWNKQEPVYFNRLQTLYNAETIDVAAYERVVNEIKTYITGRLSEIAFNQADLIKHLRLIKEYFLLGRGELFLEFIIQTDAMHATRKEINDRVAREIHQAFQTALNRTFTEMEQMTIHLPLDEVADFTHEFDDDPKLFLRLVRLRFNVKWPLHLFFSPIIIDRYNQLFRFLLHIRKMQNDLHTVWHMHREQKIAGNSMISQLRNRMLFLIDNLQYYLQVDVLESQFSILINAVQNSKDFEFIQRAHSVFQANIMSLCFLLNGSINDAANNKSKETTDANPVLVILHKIMTTIRFFCALNKGVLDELTANDLAQLELHERLYVVIVDFHLSIIFELFILMGLLFLNFVVSRFTEHIEDLMTLLSNRMAGPASEPLSQFLLRLDFNYWFSNKHSHS